MVFNPQLQPKEGYLETENAQGERVYQKTPEQVEKEALAQENALLKAQLQASADRESFLEDCVAELSAQVYA